MIIDADLHYKHRYLMHQPCKVVKTIKLPGAEFDHLSQNLLEDNDLIRENADILGYENDMHQCLLIISDERQTGVLVSSEGHNYAQYAAHVPNVRDIMLAQYMTPEIRELLEKLPVIVEDIVARRIDNRDELEIDLSAIEAKYNYTFSDSMMALGALHNALVQHSDISEVYIDIDAPTTVSFNPPTQKMEMTL